MPVHVDEDETPPPTDLRELIEALWQMRHLGEELAKVSLKVDAYTQSFARLEAMFNEFALPMLKDAIGRIDDLVSRQETNSARLEFFFEKQWPDLLAAVDGLVKRLAPVEHRQEQIAATLLAHAERMNKADEHLLEVEQRVAALELDKRDKSVAAAERKKLFTWARAGFAVAGAVVAALITKGPAFIEWLTR